MKPVPGFAEISDKNSKVLILGSFPSRASLKAGQYYAHRQNNFWPLLGAILGKDFLSTEYEGKKKMLLSSRIALWDVVYTHDNEGVFAADSRISNPVPNDFTGFENKFPGVESIYFNGLKAEEIFFRLSVDNLIPGRVSLIGHRLMSSSPANAQYTFGQKVENWRQILKWL